jgi:hypothetical protein
MSESETPIIKPLKKTEKLEILKKQIMQLQLKKIVVHKHKDSSIITKGWKLVIFSFLLTKSKWDIWFCVLWHNTKTT